MRLFLGILLTLVGTGIMVYGIVHALLELMSLYQGAMNDPLNQPEGTEKLISQHMIQSLIVGAGGIPFLIIGGILLRAAAVQRIRAHLQRKTRG